MLHTEIDHIVIAAPTLASGSAYIHATLGVPTQPGGEHAGMGTHNCLVRLGETTYLEVIAINPGAPEPSHQALFGLNRLDPASLPALITWVARCDDIEAAVAASPLEHGEIVAMTRGSLDWRLTIPPDGVLPADGVGPSLIQWNAGPHPASSLPDAGCSLIRLEGFHPEAKRIQEMLSRVGFAGEFHLTEIPATARPRLVAHLQTDSGVRQLGN